jgi:YVTN family beta-propeller protein
MTRTSALALPFLLLAPVVDARAQSARSQPWSGDSPDGDPPVLVLDGSGAHRLVGGMEVDAGPLDSELLGGACGSVSSSFHTNGFGSEGDLPSAIAFTPDSARFVVAHRSSRNLVVFDAASHTVIGVVALSGSPAHVALSSDNVHAVTANLFEDTASIVDLTTFSEIAVVPIGDQPAFLRVTPGGGKAVVGNAVSQSLSVIDIASATELFRIPGAGFAATTSIAFEPGVVTYRVNGFECPSDSLAVHPDNLNDQIDFFDLAAGTVSSIPCDPDPRGIAMTPSGSRVVVSHDLSTRRVSVIDPAAQSIVKVLTTPADLNEPIGVRPDGSKVAVAIQNATLLIDVVTGVASPSLNTASVDGYLPTPDGNHVLCVGFRGSLISWSTQTVVDELNNIVSTAVGAHAPSGQRAAMAANLFGEDLLVVNTNGAAGFLEANVDSGPPMEGDAARDVAVSADGERAVVTNVLSDTVSLIDAATGEVLEILPVGDRPADVAITPDGSLAVVANLDSSFVSVIDLAIHGVSNVMISTRGSEVEISPDGQYAYVAVVTGGDGVWRISLNSQTVSGPKLPTGDMGSTLYLFNQASGMTLSHDGATLAVCGSFTDTLTLIDTASWSVAANVPVGDFPTSVSFRDDDARLYVSNKNSGTLSVVSNAGAASAVIATIPVGAQPFESVVAPDGSELYVALFGASALGRVDLGTGSLAGTIPLGDAPQGLSLSPTGSCLYAATGNWTVSLGPGPKLGIGATGSVRQIDTAAFAMTQTIATGLPPAELEFDSVGARGFVPSPFGDGVTRLETQDGVTTYCTASTTSIPGCQAALSASGVPSVSAPGGFVVLSGAVPGGNLGIAYFNDQGPAAIPFGTQGGFICAVPGFRTPPKTSGGNAGVCNGLYQFTLADLLAAGPSVIVPGHTVNAGIWFRDPPSADAFGLSNGIEFTTTP